MPAALWMSSVEGPAEQRGTGRWARATRAPGKATAPAMSHRSRSGAYMGLARAPRERGGRGDARGPERYASAAGVAKPGCPSATRARRAWRSPGARRLDVEVKRVLPRMGAQPYGVHLVLALVVDPRLDHVRREDVALQQPVVGLLEVVEHDAEVAGELLDLLRLGGRQLVEVLVDRLTRIDLVGDPVEPRHQARRERQIRVAGVIGGAELDALGPFGLRIDGDPHARRAVALAIDEIDRRLVARHQSLVRVGRGGDDREQRRRVLEDAADVVEAVLGDVGVAPPLEEQVLPVLPERLVGVHAGAVVLEERLRHERRRLPPLPRSVLSAVLVPHDFIGHLGQGIESHIDFRLPGGRDFMVVNFDSYPHTLERQDHVRADVLELVHRRDREVALLVSRLVAEVRLLGRSPLAGAPEARIGGAKWVPAVVGLVAADRIEEEA